MSLAMARIRLLVADAYRLGQRGQKDPNRQTSQDLVREAMTDLELALRGIADAARCEDTRAVSMLFAGSIRSARLGAQPAESPEYLDGWDAAVRCVAREVVRRGVCRGENARYTPAQPRLPSPLAKSAEKDTF